MTLGLFAGGRPVAEIVSDPAGPVIRYHEAWRADAAGFPISLTMPLTAPEHGPRVATPWLMNLLPEGEPLRAMSQALGVSRDDILGLIAATGRDLAGALTMGEWLGGERRGGARRGGEPRGYRRVASAGDLERILSELPARPFLVGDDGVSMSLAGAQEKLAVALVDGEVAIPVNGAPSTHILKPDNPRLPDGVQNEALCMVLARRCGLDVAPATTGVAGARRYILIDRYDRVTGADGIAGRLHQEDFCQALGRPPAAKYQHNRTGAPGPTLADMFALTRAHMTARDINRLLDAVIFNIAIGNVDSHAKNYSILLGPRRPELAPLYDLMSGLAWPRITQNHAQDVGGQRRGRHILGRHWRRLARDCGLSQPGVIRRVEALTARILAGLPAAEAEVAAMPAGPGVLLPIFVAEIRDRARLVQANAKRTEDEADPPVDELAETDRTFADA